MPLDFVFIATLGQNDAHAIARLSPAVCQFAAAPV